MPMGKYTFNKMHLWAKKHLMECAYGQISILHNAPRAKTIYVEYAYRQISILQNVPTSK